MKEAKVEALLLQLIIYVSALIRMTITCLFAQELLQDGLLLPSVAQREGILDSFLGTPAPGLCIQHSAIIASYQVITLLVYLWVPGHVSAQQ